MRIQSMFKDDINRKINGVVKVDQDESSVLVQELNEYVITRELKKHFITFFNNYIESFNETTADIGVWISGFFGSGKSHFLKMLSYLLENKEVQGVKTVERFRAKFADDPATFMLIDRATRGTTHTILFNIDIEGSINKDKTAVLRVFAKMFYNYLGFYGENLKVAKLEQFIAKKGKTEEFRRVFEEKNGASWLESRDMLRKKSEIGKTSISKRQVVSIQKIREVRDFLRDFFDEMDVPEDEDGLIAHIVVKFNGELDHYTKLDARYEGHKYPDQGKVKQAIALIKDVLSQQKDNTALIQRVIDREDTLYAMRDELQEVEEFFKTRVTLFDAAVQYERDLAVDRDYIAKDEEAHQALNRIRLITMMPTGGKFQYDRIPELNDLMAMLFVIMR